MRRLLDGPHGKAAAGKDFRRRRMAGRDSTDPGQLRVTVVAEQVGQSEGKVERVVSQLVGGEVQQLPLGPHNARVRAQVPQCGNPELHDHPIGVFPDHAEPAATA